MLEGLAPVVAPHTRLLVLGSFPGVASLAAKQYYAHPRNGFWDLAGRLLGTDLRALPYEARLAAVLARGFGLWDVIARAEREGSLDAAIRNETHNPLADLVATLPALQAVAFNGAASAKAGRRLLAAQAGRLALFDLPSSSPAHAVPIERKHEAWRVLAGHVAPPP